VSEPRGLIASFTQHKVASNLLMLLMVMLGFLGLNRLNTQLFPNFDFDYITVTIPWRGASPEDVQRSITIPVEQAIKTLPNTKKLIARSQQGASAIFIELEDGTDLGLALDEVRQRIDSIRNLPQDAERPVIQKITNYSLVTSIMVSTKTAPWRSCARWCATWRTRSLPWVPARWTSSACRKRKWPSRCPPLPSMICA